MGDSTSDGQRYHHHSLYSVARRFQGLGEFLVFVTCTCTKVRRYLLTDFPHNLESAFTRRDHPALISDPTPLCRFAPTLAAPDRCFAIRRYAQTS